MLSTPPAPTATPQPTATQGITQKEALLPTPPPSQPTATLSIAQEEALPPTPPPTANWSPDHRYYAATDGVTLVVGDTEQGRLFAQPSAAHVWDWTVDSRFVIFRYAHPHGNRITTVFDTEAWAVTLQTPGCELLNGAPPLTFEPCGDYPVALSPVGNRLLLENGELIDLGSKERVELPAGQGRVFIESDGKPLADWSPDGSHLAFVLVAVPGRWRGPVAAQIRKRLHQRYVRWVLYLCRHYFPHPAIQ